MKRWVVNYIRQRQSGNGVESRSGNILIYGLDKAHAIGGACQILKSELDEGWSEPKFQAMEITPEWFNGTEDQP